MKRNLLFYGTTDYGEELSNSELERYARHLSLPQVGIKGQIKLKNSSVLVIGAGGLGCPVALYLGGAGVGEITVVDDDIIDVSNLNRQIAFKTNSVGGLKSENLKFSIQDLNPEVIVNAVNEANKIGADTLAILGYDGGEVIKIAGKTFLVPSFDMQVCEDIHLMFGHLVMKALCDDNIKGVI